MNRITDRETLGALMSQSLHRGVLTNCYLRIDDLVEAMQAGALFCVSDEAGSAILQRRSSFDRLYYYLANRNYPFHLPQEQTIVMEIPSRPNDDAFNDVVDYWMSLGFTAIGTRLRMRMSKEDFSEPDLNSTLGTLRIAKAEPVHRNAILHLILENFDRYAGCIPTSQELTASIVSGEIVCAFSEGGSVIGVLQAGSSRTVSEIKHLAVAESARGRGVASALCREYITLSPIKKFQLWVNEDNTTARRFYEKLGYSYDGWHSTILLRDNTPTK